MQKNFILFVIFIIFTSSTLLIAQSADEPALLKGANFIETKVYSEKENAELLKLYAGLRVADVTDGMDMVGLPNTGLVDRAIHPDWKDLDSLKHIIRGIALTVRYVPTQRPDRPLPGEEFTKWEGNFYNQFSSEAFTKIIKPGHVIVIDDVEDKDIGSIGSNNILSWYQKGAVGVVTDASSRDTDEVAKERVPLYLRHKGRGIRPGRNELESVNRPVVIGGVLVCPGDVVVADGDGVIVVPRKVAKQVAEFAHEILKKDKAGRRELYKSLGLPMDQTVE
ncbi:RraA family protein [candidate division KSB1 bacterium]|nr:RraA family protein [candidate division KSB1 bacterium]